MKVWRSSLSEDSIDRYNHTWSVLLFLLLSLITWLLPLVIMTSPSLLGLSGKDSSIVGTSCKQGYGMDQYDIKVCHNAMERLLADPHSSQNDVRLFPMNTTTPLPTSLPDSATLDKMEEFLILHRTKMDAKSDLKLILFLWTPLFLFVVALCLKVPHIIWNVLAACCKTINVDQVLKTAKSRYNLDQESSKQLRNDLALSLKDVQRRKSSFTAVSYLIMKFLMAVACLVGFLIILLLVLQKLDQNNDTLHSVGVDKDQSEFMACEYNLVMADSVRTMTQQCLFTISLDVEPLLNLASIYRTVLIVAIVYLLALLFLNLVSLFSWMFALLCSGCREDAEQDSLSLDGYFLLAMARLNAGLLTSRDIALTLSSKVEV